MNKYALTKKPSRHENKLDRRRSAANGILSKKNEAITYLAVGLGEMGYSLDFIADECGLSPSTVYYRLMSFEVKLKSYRKGTSNFSQELRKLARPLLFKRIRAMAERL